MPDYAKVDAEVRVPATPQRAFVMFTDNVGDWWPTSSNSVYQGSVLFEGGELVERRGDQVAVWAEVTRWDPPVALGLTWHAGHDATRTTDILVTFSADGDSTIVHLSHTSWDRLIDGEEASRQYAEGWPPVLAAYAAALA